jgi:hypothetical protein
MTMREIEKMMATNPARPPVDARAIAECIEACLIAQLACASCTDACLGEKHIDQLRRCVRATLDCSDVASATMRMLSRLHDVDVQVMMVQVRACAVAAAACRAECDRRAAEYPHCAVCRDACRRCEEACRKVMHRLEPAIAVT